MRKLMVFWMIILLLLFTAACGSEDENESAVTESQAPAEAAPAEPAETAAENATETEASVETEPTEEASAAMAEATEEPTAEPASTEEAAAVESASTEETDLSIVPGLEDFSSYRVSFTMDFDGTSGDQPAVGTVDMLLEVTKEPPARHLSMSMSGSTVEQIGGENETELYEVEDTFYLYNSAMGEQWISMPNTESEAFTQGFFAPDEDLDLPESANCESEPATINGVLARKCIFDATDLEETTEATYESIEGEVWLAVDGNYVVKYVANIEGFEPGEMEAGIFDFGSVKMQYELMDANGDFTITLPDEAKQAPSINFGETN